MQHDRFLHMRKRPNFAIDINLVDDYGDIYVGPLEISWCNQSVDEHGSCGFGWGSKWHLYMTYYVPCDPFTGSTKGWSGFIDWELWVYNDTVICCSPAVTWRKLKRWIDNHSHIKKRG